MSKADRGVAGHILVRARSKTFVASDELFARWALLAFDLVPFVINTVEPKRVTEVDGVAPSVPVQI
jgi:hypothetical protein